MSEILYWPLVPFRNNKKPRIGAGKTVGNGGAYRWKHNEVLFYQNNNLIFGN
jgi:hypothetical protein